MLRSRISRGIDVARLSNAVGRPGIDPRIWVSYAVLTSEPHIETTEGRQDIVVDLLLLPSGQEETARVGAMYAGEGFGFYAPLHTDDEVLVVAPSGDPEAGLVVMQRLWSPVAVPPPEVVENPEDVTLVIQEGKNLRMAVLGAGNVILSVEEGRIYLGSPEDTEPVAKGTSLKSYLESIKSTFDAHTHDYLLEGAPVPTTGPSASMAAPTDALLSTTTEVK